MSLLFSGKHLLANELSNKGHSLCDLVTQSLIFKNRFLFIFKFPLVWSRLNYHERWEILYLLYLPPVFRIRITAV